MRDVPQCFVMLTVLSSCCSDGAGRTGTYILIDMVLNKMAKGASRPGIPLPLKHLHGDVTMATPRPGLSGRKGGHAMH